MKNLSIILSSFLLVSTIGCGEATKKSEQATKKTETSQKVEKEEVRETAKEIVEITVVAKGESMAEIAFEPTSLNIPANSRVKLTLENKSGAAGMLHNFVLVELGSGQEIATAGIAAGEANQFVPKDDRVIAHTTVSRMGETVMIEFDAPAKGSYHYICTYPGHTKMIGRLNVQ